MDYKKLSLGLGAFSIGLGVTELFASRRIARSLGAEGRERWVKGFGARELAAGAGILAAPAHSATIWNRVAGDAMDLAALGLAARKNPRNKAVWGSLAFVVGATVIDALTARGLDRTTGKLLPVREADGAAEQSQPAAAAEPTPPAKPKRGRPAKATTIEPARTAQALAPAVA
jgi:hypothetical protein